MIVNVFESKQGRQEGRFEALLAFCGRHEDEGAGSFRVFQISIAGRFKELEVGNIGSEKTAKSTSNLPQGQELDRETCLSSYPSY